jgi:hypothetical protein
MDSLLLGFDQLWRKDRGRGTRPMAVTFRGSSSTQNTDKEKDNETRSRDYTDASFHSQGQGVSHGRVFRHVGLSVVTL